MGLFGFGGYSKKTFDKNTALFKERLTELWNELLNFGDKNPIHAGVCKTISEIMRKIDTQTYPGKSGDLKKIDEEILKNIDDMMDDVAEGRISGVKIRADLLSDDIRKSRKTAVNKVTDEQRQAIAASATALGAMNAIYAEQDAIRERQRSFAKKILETSSESQKKQYTNEINSLEIKSEANKRTLSKWIDNYNNALTVISSMDMSKNLMEINKNKAVEDRKTFDMLVDKALQLSEQLDEETEDIGNTGKRLFDGLDKDSKVGGSLINSGVAELDQEAIVREDMGLDAPQQSASAEADELARKYLEI